MTRRNLPSLFAHNAADAPFFQTLQSEIDRVFDRFRQEMPGGDALPFLGRDGVVPALDIADADGTVEITAEIPGVSEKDIEVSITDGVLTLKGEKTIDRKEKEKDYTLVERRHGSFRRSVSLGFTPEKGKVKASFRNGVLHLRIEKPATAASKTQKIEISKG
ncbi:Hsp20/alpha crystallin family protein [Halovulum dunhuangense]|uniref:Hsp20/alpha crystallin family protein n=1 Tax=Halovulum dunhuangense TaxID=1505036 RepID=A0A849L478_9RHOB|nr:Hsp20/alpha crystallin family protein [Halovulum dunhuangense]NNU81156.1 Hsp20/alpha crystallin family protein [Halovulum dunhuangense]